MITKSIGGPTKGLNDSSGISFKVTGRGMASFLFALEH